MRWQFWGLLVMGWLVACATPTAVPVSGRDLTGRILIWHGWEGEQAAVLESQIATFRGLHPQVTFVVVAVPPAELLGRYMEAARLGLGPDLMVGRSEWLGDLTASRLVRDITAEISFTDRFTPSGLSLLQSSTGLYGVPFVLRPPGLFYNQQKVDTPATTLAELMTQAEAGQIVLLSTQAESAFWGIQAFGQPLFGPNNLLSADQAGLLGWLNWLKTAQDNPNIILSQDETSLEQLFAAGQASYYAGSSDLLPVFQAALEQDGTAVVGIVPLPAGSYGPARPLIKADVLYFNAASSTRQAGLAVALADFLTNSEQGNVLLREAGLLPANQRVRINERLYPIAASLAQQGRSAVELPKSLRPVVLGSDGNALYTAVLSGVLSPEAAVCEYIQAIRQTLQDSQPNLESCD